MNSAAGVFFYSTSTTRYLYLLRTNSKSPTWSIPGGKIKDGETLYDGIERECREEIGIFVSEWKLIPIQKFVNNTFAYHTFFCRFEKEFIPKLNVEHAGYDWVGKNNYHKP